LSRLILLDSGPLGIACAAPGRPHVQMCDSWLTALEAAGAEIVLPAIADYEVRRELIRAGLTAGLNRLNALHARFDYLPITTPAIFQAAEYWALLRQAGLPTAGAQDLDADAILAGQAATVGQPGDTVTIATTNLRHFSRFPGVSADLWSKIT